MINKPTPPTHIYNIQITNTTFYFKNAVSLDTCLLNGSENRAKKPQKMGRT